MDTNENYAKTFQYFVNAAEKGKTGAAKDLAHCYRYGTFCEKNLAAAVEWMSKTDDFEEEFLTMSEWLEHLTKKRVKVVTNSLGKLFNDLGMKSYHTLRSKMAVRRTAWYCLNEAIKFGYPVDTAIFEECKKEVMVAYRRRVEECDEHNSIDCEAWLILAECGEVDAQRKASELYREGIYIPGNIKKSDMWLKRALEQEESNDIKAELAKKHYEDGQSYFFEGGSDKDVITKYLKAASCYEKALAGGYELAEIPLGSCYAAIGKQYYKNDDARCFELLEKAMNIGIECYDLLGSCYFKGVGTAPDPKKAEELHLKNVADGNREKEYRLGLYYHQGECITQDDVKAVTWWRKAAEQGSIDALDELAFAYFLGQGVLENKEKAIKLLKLAFRRRRTIWGTGHISDCWLKDEANKKELIAYVRKCAKAGNADAQFCLASCYEYGIGTVIHSKYREKWMNLAASQGDESAIRNLIPFKEELNDWRRKYSIKYDDPEDKLVPCRGYQAAIYYGDCCWHEANSDFTWDYGIAYLQVNFKEQFYKNFPTEMIEKTMGTYRKALDYYLLAFENGNTDGADRIYQFYKYGYGVEKDEEKSKYWLEVYQKDNGLDF